MTGWVSDPRPEEMPVGQCTNTGPGLLPVVEKRGSRHCGSADFPNRVSSCFPPMAAPGRPFSVILSKRRAWREKPARALLRGTLQRSSQSGKSHRMASDTASPNCDRSALYLSISLSPVYCTGAIVKFAAISLSLLKITLPPYNFLIRSLALAQSQMALSLFFFVTWPLWIISVFLIIRFHSCLHSISHYKTYPEKNSFSLPFCFLSV